MFAAVKLLKKEEVARNTMAFFFEKPKDFTFRAGQFGDITLVNPPETDAEGNTRGFSIAAAPYEEHLMFATRLRDTAFKRVLRHAPIGIEVNLDAPYGDFVLQRGASIPVVFIIGGIGVTPIRSMVAQATHDKTAHTIFLWHANRTLADAPFNTDFEHFATENPNFHYIPVVTDDIPSGWTGEHGRVDQAMLKRRLSDLNAPNYYLSGPQGMVTAMRQMLVGAGVDEDHIRTEEFTGY